MSTRFTWLGHATFRVETPGGKIILLDPWVDNNPACPDDEKDFDHIDLMLCTHGHTDHIGDAVAIAKKYSPQVVGIIELCDWLTSKGVENTTPMNIGGTIDIDGIKITMVRAVHSGGIQDGDQIIYGGEAVGFVVTLEDKSAFYFAGDTAVFSDMELIGKIYRPTLAILPIGDHFTMSPKEAAVAVDLLNVSEVIPMHYGTWPLLTGTVEDFREEMRSQTGVEIIELTPGQSYSPTGAEQGLG